MAIIAQRLINFFAPADIEDHIGNALWLQSFGHFTQFLGLAGMGLSYNSCNAAVAIAPHAQYDQLAVPSPAGVLLFSALYGSSRLYTGLDPSFNNFHGHIAPANPFSNAHNEQHAEQTAIRTAENLGLPFWNHGGHFHIYIDLDPCPVCGPWLQAHPANWFVHHFGQLNNQAPVVLFKRKVRKNTFGRITEPKGNRHHPYARRGRGRGGVR
jgi:hypothetical protein